MLLLMPISTIFTRAKIIFQNQFLAVDSTTHCLCSHNLSYFPCAVLLVQSCSLTRVMGTVSHCGTQTDTVQPHSHFILVIIAPERKPGCLCQGRNLPVSNCRWSGEQNFRTIGETTSSLPGVVVWLCQS